MILAMDTSGRRCGVAIWESGEIFVAEADGALKHNEILLSQIHQFLQALRIPLGDLRAVAVSSGPGSFTGLRVGMAVAKGLCWSCRVPLICVPTLEAYAHAMAANCKRAVPLMPARADEVYWSLYEWVEPDGWSAKTPCRVSHIAALPDLISGRIALCGEGLERHRQPLLELFGDRVMAAPPRQDTNSVMISLARLAAARFEAGRFEDLFQAEPAYHYPFLRGGIPGAGWGG